MLYITNVINILLLFAVSIVLGVFLVRKYELEGRWWWIGAVIYVLSQIILLPLENYMINPYLNALSLSGTLPSITVLILGGASVGILAGVCQELIRYAALRWWARDVRSFKSGLLLGIGSNGAASIILAFLVIYNFINMAIFRNVDLTVLAPAADQVQSLQSQIAAFWSTPWYHTFRESIGQFFMLVVETCLTLMIMQTFIKGHWYWVPLAIGFHSLIEGSRVITTNLANQNWINTVLGVFAIFSCLIIYALFRLRSSSNLPFDVSGSTPTTEKTD
jgi:uncharacterized membrane protein YhfC